MKNSYKTYVQTVLVLVSVVAFAYCSKVDYFIEHHNNIGPGKYRIAKIKGHLGVELYSDDHRPDTATFSYNKHGDPVSITRSRGSWYDSPNNYFVYDNKGRLTEMIENERPRPDGSWRWHKYFYGSTGQVVFDSSFIWPNNSHYMYNPETGEDGWVTGPWYAYAVIVNNYSYDAYGRIKKIVSKDIENRTFPSIEPNQLPDYTGRTVTSEYNYSYDANGNLANGTMYDDKLNPRTTNKIWMFLSNDYSLNNAIGTVAAFNEKGLPTKINGAYNLIKALNFESGTEIIYEKYK
jgi:hypothetical protein